jgi:hypothetical protein
MKSIKIILTACIASICFFSFQTQMVAASGLQLVKNGDTYYLSTTSEDNSTSTTRLSGSTATSSAATASGTTTTFSQANGLLTPIKPPTGYTKDIGQLINFILQLVIVFALLLVFFNLIMAGLQWITSGGDKGKIDASRQRIISALVGILVLSAAFAIAQLVAYILGFDSFNEVFSTIKRINPS